MADGDFGPWDYRGYTITRDADFEGTVEFFITKDGGDEIAIFANKTSAQECIDQMIADAAEFYRSNVETIGDRY